MRVRVNGTEVEVADRATVATIVASRGRRSPGVAVALNGEVVPRPRWDDTELTQNDRIEVLGAIAGG